MSVEDLKAPPHSIEAEQSVLGGLMLDNSAWDKVADLLTDDDFYRTDHGMLFAAVRGLADRQMPFDVVTLAEALDQSDQLDQAGGLPYLSSLVASTPSAANIAAYARIVRERSVVRKLIGVGVQIAEAGYNPQGREVPELLDTAERMVFDIRDAGARGGGGFRAVSELIGDAVERLDELYNSDSPITGLATGFTDFDSKTSGLQPGDLVIVAGRPSMGKTSFAMNLAEHAALRSGKAAAVFSMEMPAEQLVMRLIASLGRIDAHKLRTGRLDDQDWPRVTSATALLNEAKLYIDDTPALSPTDLRARARRLMRQEPLGLIVVDYLQLMQVVGSKENRATEISQISRDLKSLAKELGVPV
ncbi:MAG: replicative DNA helicase, partial [Gammaproteobacteria bacterium]|nr:replicative DNA helicase [Gammaproteobacteria bacterium]